MMHIDKYLITIIISISIFSLVMYGIKIREKLDLHIKLMILCFLFDFLLILFFKPDKEITSAAMGFSLGLNGLYAIFSILTILLYLWLMYLGYNIYYDKGDKIVFRVTVIAFLVIRLGQLIVLVLFKVFQVE